MCGHVGVFGFNSGKHKPLFEDMLIVNQLRGKHSTGILAVNNQGHPRVVRAVGGPNNVFYSKKYLDKIANKHDILCLLGHGRHATVGKVDETTAHPFHFKNIILAHNGTQYNYDDLIKDASDEMVFDSDSQAIAWAIANKGVEWTWAKVRGAAALVWWNIQEKSLNLLRNDGRPLYFARAEGKIVWASETWMIREMCDRNNIKISGNLQIPVKDFWWKFIYKPVSNFEENYCEVEGPKVYETHKNPFGDWENYGGIANIPYNNMHNKVLRQNHEKIEKQLNPIVDNWLDSKKYPSTKNTIVDNDPFSRLKDITEEHYKDQYSVCAFCGINIKEEYDTSVIISSFQAVCDSCASTAEHEGMNLWQI